MKAKIKVIRSGYSDFHFYEIVVKEGFFKPWKKLYHISIFKNNTSPEIVYFERYSDAYDVVRNINEEQKLPKYYSTNIEDLGFKDLNINKKCSKKDINENTLCSNYSCPLVTSCKRVYHGEKRVPIIRYNELNKNLYRLKFNNECKFYIKK